MTTIRRRTCIRDYIVSGRRLIEIEIEIEIEMTDNLKSGHWWVWQGVMIEHELKGLQGSN
jgi:hypothetical protein